MRDRFSKVTKNSKSERFQGIQPSMDASYEVPEMPEEVIAFSDPELAELARLFRTTLRPTRSNSIYVYFRIRRNNYETLLHELISTGKITKQMIYLPEYLPHWTLAIKLRILVTIPFGQVLDAIRMRLGIESPRLRFCIDGFFGMANFSDVFGKTGNVCPWMEISNNSSTTSLRLMNGDNIFMSLATIPEIVSVENWRKRHATGLNANN